MESVAAFRSFTEQRGLAYGLGYTEGFLDGLMAETKTANYGARSTRKQLRAMLKTLARHGVITTTQLTAIEAKINSMPARANARKGGLGKR